MQPGKAILRVELVSPMRECLPTEVPVELKTSS